jgi:predicted GNAT superfamily acetyltransferase
MTNAAEVASMDPMTDLHSPRTEGGHGADAAVAAADAAAHAAGVRIREIAELDELDAVYQLFDKIWRPDPTNPPVTTKLMRALTKAGNHVTGAFDSAELVGACVGFFGAPADRTMHSHITGVSAGVEGRNVGFALKVHQRAWALRRGVSAIGWTFDPLVSRNAYFNLVKLAATPAEYLPNFYGGMHDGINGDDDTDRLLVHWDLDAPEVAAACAGRLRPHDAGTHRTAGATIALAPSEHGRPVAGPLHGSTVLVAVPPDIETLRLADPDRAKQWRIAVRDVLATLMADGARVTGFDKAGWYIVTRDETIKDGR